MKLDDVFGALANETRRKIVEILAAEPAATAPRIASEFELSQSVVSQHLTWMREVGILRSAWSGRSRVYSLNPDAFVCGKAWFVRVASHAENLSE